MIYVIAPFIWSNLGLNTPSKNYLSVSLWIDCRSIFNPSIFPFINAMFKQYANILLKIKYEYTHFYCNMLDVI